MQNRTLTNPAAGEKKLEIPPDIAVIIEPNKAAYNKTMDINEITGETRNRILDMKPSLLADSKDITCST